MLLTLETHLLFPARKFPQGNWNPSFQHTSVDFESHDGTKLNGWMLPAANEGKRYFLVCHGIGEHVPYSAMWLGNRLAQQFDGHVFVFDYRGYGKSEGKPIEAGLKMDGERAMEVFCEQHNIQPSDVIVVGHSIGGGVGTHIASKMGCKALVLQKTFDVLVDVAAKKVFWAPVRWFMHNRFDSCASLANYDGPVLQSHGELDQVVPISHARRLFESTRHPESKFLGIPNLGHDQAYPSAYWKQLENWLCRIEEQASETNREVERSSSVVVEQESETTPQSCDYFPA